MHAQNDVLSPDSENSLVAFPTLVADYFDADRQILAWSGAYQNPFPSSALTALADTTRPPSIPMLFEQLIGGEGNLLVNASAWPPQVTLPRPGLLHLDWINAASSFAKESSPES